MCWICERGVGYWRGGYWAIRGFRLQAETGIALKRGGIKRVENHEKLCFTFFAFLPPYIGVSGLLVYVKR